MPSAINRTEKQAVRDKTRDNRKGVENGRENAKKFASASKYFEKNGKRQHQKLMGN